MARIPYPGNQLNSQMSVAGNTIFLPLEHCNWVKQIIYKWFVWPFTIIKKMANTLFYQVTQAKHDLQRLALLSLSGWGSVQIRRIKGQLCRTVFLTVESIWSCSAQNSWVSRKNSRYQHLVIKGWWKRPGVPPNHGVTRKDTIEPVPLEEAKVSCYPEECSTCIYSLVTAVHTVEMNNRVTYYTWVMCHTVRCPTTVSVSLTHWLLEDGAGIPKAKIL